MANLLTSPRKSTLSSGSGLLSIPRKTNKLNEDALRALLHDHLTMGIESIVPHFLHVAPAAPSVQARATRTALLNNTEVLAALARLREIETQFTSINKRDELAMYGPLVRCSRYSYRHIRL